MNFKTFIENADAIAAKREKDAQRRQDMAAAQKQKRVAHREKIASRQRDKINSYQLRQAKVKKGVSSDDPDMINPD